MREHKEYIKEVNNSKTIIVFIHGILEGPNQFNDFVKLIDNKISIVNILLPGHGLTGKDFVNSNMNQWKTYVYKIIKNLEKRYENIFIVGHSMGALLAIDAYINYPNKIRGLFLLAIPLSIHLKLEGIINALKVTLNLVKEDDVMGNAAKECYSIDNQNIFSYLTYIPRFIELFKECFYTRHSISKINIPTIIFQCEKDEFVSNRTLSYINNIELHILKKSKHFYYLESERKFILDSFLKFINSYN